MTMPLDLVPIATAVQRGHGLSNSDARRVLGEVARLRQLVAAPPTRPLTQRQSEVLSFVVDFSDEYGYAPSFDEIAERFGYHSNATVYEHLANLEQKGWISREYNTSRGIKVLNRPTGAVRS